MTGVTDFLERTFGGGWEVIGLKAAQIVLILVAAFVVSRILRKVIKRATARLAEKHLHRAEAEPGTCEASGLVRAGIGQMLSVAQRNERAAQRAKTLGATISHICTFVIYAIALMLCLSELGINLGPILAGAGIAGVALGFGAQTLVRDFLSGIFIVIEDQYGVGDIVDVGEASGVVEEVTLRITRVRGLDGTLWHVPNGEIRRSGNRSQHWARAVLDIPVPYDADVRKASALIKRVADELWQAEDCKDILEEPEVWGVEDFLPDSLAIRVVLKTRPGSQWNVARELRARLKEAYDREGLEVPFPQRVVWIRQQKREQTQLSPTA